jgi:hypothetical protein
MFCKRIVKKKKGGGTSLRTRRLIKGHTMNILTAGAANVCIGRQRERLERMGLKPHRESRSQPFSPSLSKGARILFEHACAAYVQSGVERAFAVLNAVGAHKRMRPDVINLGFEEVNKGNCAPGAPRRTVLTHPKAAAKKSKSSCDAEVEEPVADGSNEGKSGDVADATASA